MLSTSKSCTYMKIGDMYLDVTTYKRICTRIRFNKTEHENTINWLQPLKFCRSNALFVTSRADVRYSPEWNSVHNVSHDLFQEYCCFSPSILSVNRIVTKFRPGARNAQTFSLRLFLNCNESMGSYMYAFRIFNKG